MKFCAKENAVEIKNGNACVVTECPLGDADLNVAVAKITGRYPETGCAVNRKVNEMVYIQEGQGKICINGELTELNAGDTLLVEAGEVFFWEGNMTLFIACNPAFTPDQHQHIEECKDACC